MSESFRVTVALDRALTGTEQQPIAPPELFIRFATWSTQFEPDDEIQDICTDLADALTPHLTSEQTADWWHEIRQCLIGREKAGTVGPAWDEVGIDWDARVMEAAERLAGVS